MNIAFWSLLPTFDEQIEREEGEGRRQRERGKETERERGKETEREGVVPKTKFNNQESSILNFFQVLSLQSWILAKIFFD